MKQIIVISGPIAVGKTTFSKEIIDRYPCEKVSTRNYILAAKSTANERAALQRAGVELDEATNGAWVAEAVGEVYSSTEKPFLLVDSARTAAQVTALRDRFGPTNIHHFHLTAPANVLEQRYNERTNPGDTAVTYEQAKANLVEADIDNLAEIADVVIHTERSSPQSCVTYATAGRLQVNAPAAHVDIFVGGQWGSEGKGNICALLAKEYDILVRVGGPNAGHKVEDPEYTYRQLPSGTGSNEDAEIYIAAGSTISLETLLKELDDHPWLKTRGRLVIDGQAMIIEDEDKEIEGRLLEGISSTKQGVGSAAARKILGRNGAPGWGPEVRLARDMEALKPYIGNVGKRVEEALACGKKVMLEGTQGTELSIHHGSYPHVTSRETSAAGCLSDSGIPYTRLRRVTVVARTYPIRVGGESGPMGTEITFSDIAQRSGLPADQLEKAEIGSVSGRRRRVAEFDWERMRRSVYWNGATDIALTFVDYLGESNRHAVDFNGLSGDARKFIADVERVCGVPVSLISKDFGRKGLIDRRNWND
ncbi:adenylosuccinate synthetase [Agrobacterium sp. 22094]|uniref:adenylosuccinate synthetase n=1 Tax=Agrobacterium sp. 22094 TaxID=3453872 RepID=UPI003F84A56B